ncbi:hypothetical protein F5X68DRAFT_265050 [Plectosphaerella plurivora]|uniref:Uncharacterized protein n=1 Tax=Plectosphaerella plurivora TaxID=936078 RepID=A0A9P8V3N9_9PEZI|nr:hypothetical protein F5X68DRAFT_265050 [Plectosphaerella plurivora]
MADKEVNWVGPKSYRIVTIICFLVLFPLGIPASIIFHTGLPALGLVPLAASTIFSLILLRKQKTKKAKHSPFFIFSMDFILASCLLVVYLFTWFEVAGQSYWWYTDNAAAMLAGYATIPMLVGLGIHGYLAGRTLCLSLVRKKKIGNVCPNCSHQIQPTATWFPRSSDDLARLLAGDDAEEGRYRDEEGSEHNANEPPEVVRISPAPSTGARATLSDN